MVTTQTEYTCAVTDAAGFAQSRNFSIKVAAPAFGLASVPDQAYSVDEKITPLELRGTIGGSPIKIMSSTQIRGWGLHILGKGSGWQDCI